MGYLFILWIAGTQNNREKLHMVRGAFRNYTKVCFPHNMAALLSYGPKFVVPYLDVRMDDIIHMMRNVEDTLYMCDPMAYVCKLKNWKEDLLRRILAVRDGLKRSDRFVVKCLLELEDFLLKNSDIVIVEADKGKVTVAIERSEYNELLQGMLYDGMLKGVFQKVMFKQDMKEKKLRIVKAMEMGYLARIGRMEKLGIYRDRSNVNIGIERKMINTLRKYDNRIATMHALIKIHKPQKCMRNIISKKMTLNAQLGRVLVDILRGLKDEWDTSKKFDVNVKDIGKFLMELRTVEMVDGMALLTMDVKNMFNSINRIELLRILDGFIAGVDVYNKEVLMELIRFDLLNSNYFQIGGELYEQKLGLPMGSPTSCIYAEIYMDILLRNSLSKLREFGVLYLWKYVDDILIIRNGNETQDMLNMLEQDLKLEFEVVQYNNDFLDYLDMRIIKRGRDLRTKWYKKDYVSDRLMNYKSFQDYSAKMGMVKGRIDRVIRLTDVEFLRLAIDRVIMDLKENNYHIRSIGTIMKKIFENDGMGKYGEDKMNIFLESYRGLNLRSGGGLVRELNFTEGRRNLRNVKRKSRSIVKKYIKIPYIGENRTRILKRRVKEIIMDPNVATTSNAGCRIMSLTKKVCRR